MIPEICESVWLHTSLDSHMPPWPNGQGVGLLIRRLRVRVPQGVFKYLKLYAYFHFLGDATAIKFKATPRGFEPLRAEPNGFRVHLLNRSDTVSLLRTVTCFTTQHPMALQTSCTSIAFAIFSQSHADSKCHSTSVCPSG